MHQVLIGFVTLALCVAAAMRSAQNADIGVEKISMTSVWAHAFVAVGIFKITPDKVAVNQPLPVVIHSHGAIGIDPELDVLWGSFIKELG